MNRMVVTRDYIREKLNIGEQQISEALKDVKPISDVKYRTDMLLEEYERCADIAEERKGSK